MDRRGHPRSPLTGAAAERGSTGRMLALAIALAACGTPRPPPDRAPIVEEVAPAPPEPPVPESVAVEEPEAPPPELPRMRPHFRRALRDVLAAAWEPSSGILVAASSSGTVVVHRRDAGAVLRTVRLERAFSEASVFVAPREALVLAVTPVGDTLGLAVDLEAGAETVLSDPSTSAVARPDSEGRLVVWDGGERLALSRGIGGEVTACDPAEPAEVFPVALGPDAATGLVYAYPDGRGPEAWLVVPATCEILAREPVESGTLIDLSPDGRTLVLGAPGSTTAIDLEGGARRAFPAGAALAAEVGALVSRDERGHPSARSLDTGEPVDWSEHRAAIALRGPIVDGTAVLVAEGSDVVRLEGLADGGVHSVHGADVHPAGRLVTIRTRAGVVAVGAAGVRVLPCLDERPATFSADGRRLEQGDGGRCDVETGLGVLAPVEDYGSGYGYYDDDPEGSSGPSSDTRCGPSGACVEIPRDGGAWTLTIDGGRGRRLAATAGRTEVSWAPDGSFFVASGETSRVFALPSGREDRRRRLDGPALAVFADGTIVVGTEPARLVLTGGRSVELDVGPDAAAHLAESPEGALLCTPSGLVRFSMDTGARTALTSAECAEAHRLADVIVTRDRHGARSVLAPDGTLVGTIAREGLTGDTAIDREILHRCVLSSAGAATSDLEVIEVRTARTLRVVPGYCDDDWEVAADGSLRARLEDDVVVVERASDRTSIRLVSTWDGDPHAGEGATPHVLAVTDDGAFWASPSELALLDVVDENAGPRSARAIRGDAEETVRRFYRPTLLSDFFEGHRLPTASP